MKNKDGLAGGIFTGGDFTKGASAKGKTYEDNAYPDFDDCSEMFQEGYSDSEIAHELGVHEDYVKKIREEYLKEY